MRRKFTPRTLAAIHRRRCRLSAAHRESKGYASCAYCNDDKTQPGCECFETGYDAVPPVSPPAVSGGTATEGSGDGSGDDSTDDGSTDWRSLPLDCGAGADSDTDDLAAGADNPIDTEIYDEYTPGVISYPCR